MEWNALTYAGCTVWNVHNERIRGRAVGGTKRRPRSEWLIKEGTHDALITREEAEALLRGAGGKSAQPPRPCPEDYILGGLIETPAGEAWNGCRDGAWRSYRLGRGRRVNAQAVEHAVLEKIPEDLKSPKFVQALVRAARELAQPDPELQAIERAYVDIEALDRKIAKITELLPEGPQRPLLEQIRRFEERREKIRAGVIDHETRLKQARAIAGITERDVVAILDNLANDLATLDAVQLREFVRAIVTRIVMDAGDLTCRIHYEIPAVSGDRLASPRGFEPRLPP
jgi:site-specific DNA recombinase